MKTCGAQTADQWRTWLDEHHDSESEVWLVFHKRHTGVESVAYVDALDEALCFGWVDSVVKRLNGWFGVDNGQGHARARPWRLFYGAIVRRPDTRCTRNKTIAITKST